MTVETPGALGGSEPYLEDSWRRRSRTASYVADEEHDRTAYAGFPDGTTLHGNPRDRAIHSGAGGHMRAPKAPNDP